MKKFDKVVSSGAEEKFATGSVRDVQLGKGRFDLLPLLALVRLGRHFENGSKRYGERNWELGQPLSIYWNSAFRHLVKVMLGMQDEDHEAAAAWNIMCLIETRARIEMGVLPASLNDLPKTFTGSEDTMNKLFEFFDLKKLAAAPEKAAIPKNTKKTK